jgi:hypothetical protein
MRSSRLGSGQQPSATAGDSNRAGAASAASAACSGAHAHLRRRGSRTRLLLLPAFSLCVLAVFCAVVLPMTFVSEVQTSSAGNIASVNTNLTESSLNEALMLQGVITQASSGHGWRVGRRGSARRHARNPV